MKHKIGNKYGMLTLIKRLKNDKGIFKCDCGKEIEKRIGNVVSGSIKSCGCNSHRGAKTTHGLSKTRFEHIWNGMVCRCHKEYHNAYKRYSSKGITVCDKWRNFQGFIDDMYSSYLEHIEKFGEKETTIDRIDNSKGYYKENCRWATNKEQANNTSSNIKNKKLIFKGNEMSVLSFCDENNIKYQRYYQLKKQGMTPDEMIQDMFQGSPSKKMKRLKIETLINKDKFNLLEKREKKILEMRFGLVDGVFHTLEEVGQEFGVTRERIRQVQAKAFSKILK